MCFIIKIFMSIEEIKYTNFILMIKNIIYYYKIGLEG